MDNPSSIPVRSSGIPRPTSRLPVPRAAGPPAASSQLRSTASSDQLRKKPSLSSISRPGQLSQAQAPIQPKPQLSLRTKTSRTSLARSNTSASTSPSVTANTSLSRAPLSAATRRASALPAFGTNSRPSTSDGTAFNKRPFARPPSRQTRPTPQPSPPLSGGLEEDVLGDLDGFRSASRASSRAGFHEVDGEQDCAVEEVAEPSNPPATRKSRPSLSERTIESLSQLPSSPAGGKGRRRSSFFNSENNGMPPPLRPASALSNSGKRPTTSDGTPKATPATPRRFGAPAGRGSMTVPGKRSVSAAVTTNLTATPSKTASVSRAMSTIKKPPLSQVHNTLPTPKVRPLSNSKSMTARTPKTRPSLANTFGQAISPPGTAVSSPSTPSPNRNIASRKTPETSRKISNSSAALREQIAKAKAARRSDMGSKLAEAEEPTPVTPSKPANSSNALREQIAKAKEAARRAKATSPVRTNTPPRDAIIPDPSEIATFDFGLDDDPFNQRSKGSKSLLRKRVDAARVDGRLNIAAMGMKEIPEEVLNMYKYDPDDDTVAWGEVVDLTAILIADNELESLPERMFPDADLESLDDSDEVGPQFGGVQNLDVHGNLLREVPVGLRRLGQLSKLNLTRNKLSVEVFQTLSQIPTLRELKLAENALEGDLPASLGNLVQLESLELQGNKLGSLPPEIRELAHLRILNISDNRMGALPVELFTSVPIVELNASRNNFSGSFFSVGTVPHLQKLQLANNCLTALCESNEISLPALQYLDVSVNRLSTIPDMSSWIALTTFLVGENKITSLPEGFVSLHQLRHADFTANDLTKLDERIALMEGLENLTLAANPLRERKFLTMNAEDIKRDLYTRLEPRLVHAISEEEGNDDQTLAGDESGWKLTPSGTLDLSFQNLTEMDESAVLSFSQANNIRQLYLQQNYMTSISAALSHITHLSVLDLSKNNIVTPLSDPLHLPKLRELRLNGNKIVSLFSLTTHLSAPTLQHLDVSNNRITGSLPCLRDTFPELILLMANDNTIDEVSAESLQGLKIVNLSNNDIPRLEPRIGLHAGTLTSLDVEGNKFRVPNYAVLRKGTEAVLAWLRDKIPSPTEEFFNPGSPGSPGY